MSYCAELVTFTLKADEALYLRLRAAAIEEVKSAHPQLISVPLCAKREDGSWIDVWVYETKDAADAANADVENLPEFLKMFALLDGVSIEMTEFPTAGKDPVTAP